MTLKVKCPDTETDIELIYIYSYRNMYKEPCEYAVHILTKYKHKSQI